MNVRKFIAPNAGQALRRVKAVLGPEAVVLATRSVDNGVEITAMAPEDLDRLQASGKQAETVPGARKWVDDDVNVSLSGARPQTAPKVEPWDFRKPARPAARAAEPVHAERPVASVRPRAVVEPQAAPSAPAVARPRRAQVPAETAVPAEAVTGPTTVGLVEEKPAAHDAAVNGMMTELQTLRQIVEQHLAGFAWGELSREAPAKTEVLRRLLDCGFSPRFARQLIHHLPAGNDVDQGMQWARSAASRHLLTTAQEDDLIEGGGVFAIVGPTGVGKTTTTAKLAARCVVRHGASKLALITTDSYRIGAQEQLRIYGRILGVPVHVVRDADDLQRTLGELSGKHMVLIDTVGMSQRDRHVTEQIAMLSGNNVKRLLLVNAASRGDTLDEVVTAYNGADGQMPLAGAVLTKVDEAASLAPALDVIMRHGLRLHYVANGQRVPEDLHLPNRAYLLHRAFRVREQSQDHRFMDSESGLMMASSGLAAARQNRLAQ